MQSCVQGDNPKIVRVTTTKSDIYVFLVPTPLDADLPHSSFDDFFIAARGVLSTTGEWGNPEGPSTVARRGTSQTEGNQGLQ